MQPATQSHKGFYSGQPQNLGIQQKCFMFTSHFLTQTIKRHLLRYQDLMKLSLFTASLRKLVEKVHFSLDMSAWL